MPTIEIDKNHIPQHIAIIMDGNGRWAQSVGKKRSEGHKAGVDTVRRITAECTRLGVQYLTLYTFSTENWNRPADEVLALMGLVLSSLEDKIFMTNNVRFRMIGDRTRLPLAVRKKIEQVERRTAANSTMTMVIALSYSARWEITEAAKKISQQVMSGNLAIDDINEKIIGDNLATTFMPDPDLLIRTGGEWRISNYLLWQIAYTELYFCDTFWPAFSEEDLHKAIVWYQSRQRRYGRTEQQVMVRDNTENNNTKTLTS